MIDLETLGDILANKYTPEYFEQLSKINYKEDREYPENFSNWYPEIIDFGKFKHAEIISNQILTLEQTKLLQAEYIQDLDKEAVRKALEPTILKMKPGKTYNLKNGCFSNKFEFNTSLVTIDNIVEQLWKINYKSSMYDTGGYTEIVLRELIPYDLKNTPTIYEGMPLREEVRVFYNMDLKEIEYIEDYWKYKYCAHKIYNKTDSIIFDWFHNKLKTRKTQHVEKLKELTERIENNIDTLKFTDKLKGIWSIDFMYVEETDEIYLIDMARGFRSAYWNPDKLKHKITKEE